ncbi:MAG TPA: twin-arginine translocase TatA/TatE family subunit [Firmicutes bacterium]|nr:twin-arginine translocase TatA/TatE family subunit [Bacillota bacterium]
MRLGTTEILLILGLILILFGPKKLPELGRSLGRGLREFKQATTELKESVSLENEEE